jgi:glycosyltransferase involved in cell wall biosynthesis
MRTRESADAMRICRVGELTGGVGVYGQNLIRGLAKLGVELTVITPTPESSPAGRALRVKRHFGRGRWLPQARAFARGLHEAAGAYDIVHFTDARFAVFAGKGGAVPIVGTMNDYFYAITGWMSGAGSFDVYEDWLLRHLYYNFTRVVERTCLRRLDGVLCIAGAVANVLHDRYAIGRDRLHVVPYGIDYGDTQVELVPGEGPMILFAGGNFQRKGLAVLIDAASTILKEFPAARFVVLGHSADRELMQQRCERAGVRRAFEFVGQVDYATLYRYYMSAHVFAMPSLLEAFGIPYLEAMHCGVPVVASDAAGPDEYLLDGTNCLVVRAGNVTELAAATVKLLRNVELARRLVENGKQTAQEFTVQQMTLRTVHAYRSVMANAAARNP